MQAATQPADEAERLAALQRTGLLDTPPEERFDRVVRIAQALFQVPIAMVTLVDADRQWQKAASGYAVREIPRSISFCAHAILSDQPLVVVDAAADPRFAGNPLVTGEPFIRFYAGQPLHSPDGRLLGTLCLIDRQPRGMDAGHLAMLSDVAAIVEGEIGGGPASDQEAQLRAVTKELEDLLRVKGDLVSIVGHEFRTALTGIQGFSEMMKGGGFSPEEMRDFAADIHKDALRLNQMITDMLDLDRLESGRMELALATVDVNGVVTEEVERFRVASEANPVRTELDASLPPAYADAEKVKQVLENLLSNAVKYSPAGSPITVRTSLYGGGMARISVSDEGPGVQPELQEAIFERHGRAPTVQTRKVRGTGLGLPLVRQIALMHGGRAWVESSPGFGSTFHFSIPFGGPAGRLEADTAP